MVHWPIRPAPEHPMKVLDLQCHNGHEFEGWFASQEDFDQQKARGLLTCPVCGHAEVVKLLSAPRLNLGHTSAPPAPSAAPAPASAPALPAPEGGAALAPRQMQALWMKMVRHVMAHTEDVGPRFAEEARRMHHGETAERGIRGQATAEQTRELLEEGIEVLPLPLPEGLKGPLQ